VTFLEQATLTSLINHMTVLDQESCPAISENAALPIVLSVVMPAYNEEASIEQVILEHLQVLERIQEIADWEIVCLDDGSVDQTPKILERVAESNEKLRVIRHPENRGIYESFAHLFQAARGTHIYATAADGQWPAANLIRMLPSIASGSDLVVGVRLNRQEVYSLQRRLVSSAFNLLPLLLFGVKTVDAGSIKLGTRDVFALDLISQSPFVEAERIIRAQRSGYQVDFVPIEFLPRLGGKATGAKWGNIVASTHDCIRCVGAYGLGRGRQPSHHSSSSSCTTG